MLFVKASGKKGVPSITKKPKTSSSIFCSAKLIDQGLSLYIFQMTHDSCSLTLNLY